MIFFVSKAFVGLLCKWRSGFSFQIFKLQQLWDALQNACCWIMSQSNELKRASHDEKKNQNWKNIYVVPFKTMAIVASCSFLIHMNVKEFK